ncbi:hypothetical protein [Mucilaginibacter pineti]|uniref:hypothetical protein n=1 Tax=Mucilaginibacter pineti TaxID=1391627 RepID=UPI000B830232|nr:hypothetical protein [Mucilaginibacter pineti]
MLISIKLGNFFLPFFGKLPMPSASRFPLYLFFLKKDAAAIAVSAMPTIRFAIAHQNEGCTASASPPLPLHCPNRSVPLRYTSRFYAPTGRQALAFSPSSTVCLLYD